MIINKQKSDLKGKQAVINNHPAFSKMSIDIQKEIIQYLQIKQYQRNQIVYTELQEQSTLYIVKSGEFKMSKRVLQRNQVFQYIKSWRFYEICLLEKGETFGIELIDQEPFGLYKYTVSCNSIDGIVYQLQLDVLKKIINYFHIQTPVNNLFLYQNQILKNQLYLQREQKLNQLYCNIHQSFQYKKTRSISTNILLQPNNTPINNNNNHRSISYDHSYCNKIQNLINYPQELIQHPKRIIKTEILEDDNYINQSLNQYIKIMKPFITDFQSGRQDLNVISKQIVNSFDRYEQNQKEKIFRLKVMQKLGIRPKKKLQITLNQFQHLNKNIHKLE